MLRLTMLIFTIAAGTLAGTGVVIALVMGQVSTVPIVAAAVIGFVLALPVSWLIARQLS